MKRIAVIFLIVASAACSKSTTTPTGNPGNAGNQNQTPALIGDFAAKAAAAGTAHGVMEIAGQANGKAFTMSGTMAMDFKNNLAHATMVMPTQLSSGGSAADRTIETIVAGGYMYVKLPAALNPANPSKPWKRSAAAAGGSLFGGSNPSQFLDLLRGVSNDIRTIGHENVRGVATTHFHATVDLQKAIANVPADQRPALQSLAKQSPTMPIDVWMGSDGLPRREKLTYAVSGSSFTFTMDMFDWGKRVDITVPPASQVQA